MAKYDLDETYEDLTDTYNYLQKASKLLPKGKTKDELNNVMYLLQKEIEELEEQIEERDREEYEYETTQRQREYREMQGF